MPEVRILVGDTPVEELSPDRLVKVRKHIGKVRRTAIQQWVNNNFERLFEEALRELSRGG